VVFCDGKVGNGTIIHGNGGIGDGLNVESHLCFRMCLSYSATVILVCVRVLVSIILFTVLFIEDCCN
jgi:hypothetical protein